MDNPNNEAVKDTPVCERHNLPRELVNLEWEAFRLPCAECQKEIDAFSIYATKPPREG